MTLFLSFPGCSHPGLVGAPSPGCDFTGLVAWSLLAPRSWKPPCQSTSFARSVVLWRWCGADDSLPLVSSLLAARFGLWPYGLAIAAFPLVSRPWTGLCWSHPLSLSSGGSVRGYTAPVGWLRGAFPCFAYCPTSDAEFLRVLCFKFRAKSSRWGHPSGSSLSQSSIGTKSLPPPSWCLVGVFAMGSPCRVGVVAGLDRNEDFFAHLP